jgi:deazaflavin-dependent oxidoreductase (nitroreductase family)
MPTDAEFLARNAEVIAALRAGRSGDLPFPVLLLTTTGARTGRPRTSPLGYTVHGDAVVVIGTRAGTPRQPSWFHNLLADPAVTVELGGSTYEAKAVVLAGAERDRVFAAAAEYNPIYAEYRGYTEREIPVVVLAGVPVPPNGGS